MTVLELIGRPDEYAPRIAPPVISLSELNEIYENDLKAAATDVAAAMGYSVADVMADMKEAFRKTWEFPNVDIDIRKG